MNPEFHFQGQSFLGNIFSNTWEEIIYRGFLFQIFTVVTGSTLCGALLSSCLFGATHDQYPVALQIYVGFIGFSLCILKEKTKGLFGPIWAHCVADWLLDLFF